MLASVIALMAAALAAGSDGQSQTNQAESTPAVSTPAPRPADDPDKVVCRSEEVTGSRFKRRVCHTRSEWDQMTAKADDAMRQINERAFGGPTGGGLSGQ